MAETTQFPRYRWEIAQTDGSSSTEYGKPLSITLAAKDINSDNRDAFLNPTSGHLHSPFLLPDCEKAADRLAMAVKDNEPILIYGDYDVDGVTGGTIAYKGLKELGGTCRLFLPERKVHGYGVNRDVMEKAVKEGIRVVLSIDCGTSNVAEAEFLRNSGIDFIVADHHTPPDKLPDVHSHVNPKLPGSKYPYDNLCAASIGTKLVAAVHEKSGRSAAEFLSGNLPLLALATIADVCHITGENRTIVARGIAEFNDNCPPGLRFLCEKAKVDLSKVDGYTFGFILGPRLNAAGRLDSPKLAASLLLTEDESKYKELAIRLETLNRKRRKLTSVGMEKASAIIETGDWDGGIIAVRDSQFDEGVMGLIASDLTRSYRRPALVATDAGNGLCKGSGRSSGNFDLLEALRSVDGKLISYGGHKAAVGFQLSSSDFPEFASKVAAIDLGSDADEKFAPTLQVDGELSPEDISEHTINELSDTRPWGIGNSEPTFLFADSQITDCVTMGDGTHIRLQITKDGQSMNAIAFGINKGNAFMNELRDRADLVAVPEINEYRGNRSIRLKIRDIKFH